MFTPCWGTKSGVAPDEDAVCAEQPRQAAADAVDRVGVEVGVPDAADVVCVEGSHRALLSPCRAARYSRTSRPSFADL